MFPGGIPSTTSSIQSSSSVAMTTTQPSCWSPRLSSFFSAKLLTKSTVLPECPSNLYIWSCHSRVRLTAEDLSTLCTTLWGLASPHPTTSPGSSHIPFLSKTRPLVVPWAHQAVWNRLPDMGSSLLQEQTLYHLSSYRLQLSLTVGCSCNETCMAEKLYVKLKRVLLLLALVTSDLHRCLSLLWV